MALLWKRGPTLCSQVGRGLFVTERCELKSVLCLSSFESHLQRLTRWLERMDVRMSTELPEGRHGDQERVTLERVEEFQHEVLKERLEYVKLINIKLLSYLCALSG